jgi:hypothetical protein
VVSADRIRAERRDHDRSDEQGGIADASRANQLKRKRRQLSPVESTTAESSVTDAHRPRIGSSPVGTAALHWFSRPGPLALTLQGVGDGLVVVLVFAGHSSVRSTGCVCPAGVPDAYRPPGGLPEAYRHLLVN